MAHPRCLACASPAQALHRVLVSGLLSRATNASSPATARHAISSSSYLFPPRLFSSSSSSNLLTQRHPPSPIAATGRHIRTFASKPPPARRPDVFGKRLINDKIPYTWIRIASAPPESTLSTPRRTEQVLSSLNTKTHTLMLVAPPSSDTDSSSEARTAICRIIDNAAARAAASEASRVARRRAVDSKELELSWSIAENDISHKLRRLRAFLDKGLSVEVILAQKKRGRTAGREESEAVLMKVREAVASVEGAKEIRKMDGEVGGLARLFLEGPSEKKRVKKKQQQEEEEE